jgi:hypothetical protein
VIARLRQAGAPYTVINEVVRTMVASMVAFSAQVAMVPDEILVGWEERLASVPPAFYKNYRARPLLTWPTVRGKYGAIMGRGVGSICGLYAYII